MKNKIVIIFVIFCCLAITGCSYPRSIIRALKNSSETSYSTTTNTITLDKNGVLKTDQLELMVNSAQLSDYWSGYYVEDPTWRYLIINVTIKNINQNSAMLDLYAGDFKLSWEDLGLNYIEHEETYSDEQLADYNDFIKIFKNTSRTGNLVYVVPENIHDFQLLHHQYRLPLSAEESDIWHDDYYGYEGYNDYGNDYGNYSGTYPSLIETYGTMETDLFNLTINSMTTLLDDIDTNGQYVAVNVTIENTSASYSSLDFYNYDFTLSWKNFYDNGRYPEDFSEDSLYTEQQLPDSYMVFSGDSKTGDLIFLVPKNVTDFAIEYYDSYESSYRTYIVNTEASGL